MTMSWWIQACGDGSTEPEPPSDPPRPTAVAVTPATAELSAIGETVQLTAEVRDQNGNVMTGAAVQWSTSSASVVSVGGSGLVTATGNGTATVTATVGSVSGSAAVTVVQVVSAVTLTPAADTLIEGDTLSFSAELTDANGHAVAGAALAWASSDPGVAVVDGGGLVTAIGAGEATITATVSGAVGRAVLTVLKPPNAISFASSSTLVTEGGTAVLQVELGKPTSAPVEFTYSIGADDNPATDDADSADHSHGSSGAVRVPVGASRADIEIAITDDDAIEPTREVFTITLDAPSEGTGYIRGSPHTSVVTIEEGVCDRTPQVRDEITRLLNAASCHEPERADLAGITNLDLCSGDHCEYEGPQIAELREGDFLRLSGLQRLDLAGNHLTSLPHGVFSGLAGLETLWLAGNDLAALPAGAFSGLSRVQQLSISGNRLSTLPAGVFSDLSGLWWLTLSGNPIAKLPQGIFDGLANLYGLEMTNGQLNELPHGVFAGLTSLHTLDLQGHPGTPFSLTVQPLRIDSEDILAPGPAQVVVRLAHGAPSDIRLPLSVHGGALSTDTVLIGAGSVDSEAVTVTRSTSGVLGTQVVAGPAPALPEHVRGLEIEAVDPIVLFEALSPTVTLASRADSVPEGGTATLRVALSQPANAPVTFTYTVGRDDDPTTDDADSSDHSLGPGGSVRIPAGASSADIQIAINDDDAIEPTREVFTVTLDVPVEGTGYVRGFQHTALITIEEGVCDRTPSVLDEIMAVVGSGDCTDTDDRDLASILLLDIRGDAHWERSERGFAWTRELVARFRSGECDLESEIAAAAVSAESATCGGTEEPIRRWSRTAKTTTTLREGDFDGLSNLQSLYLLRLGLTELPERVFAGLTNLGWLSLQFNELTSLPAGVFSDLTSLWEGLILANNRLASLPETVFAGLFPDPETSGLPGRGLLILEYNELTEVPPGAFRGLTGVDWLFLNGNRLTNLPPGAFSELSRMTFLNLDHNQLSTVPNGAFAGLSALATLALSHNRLTALPTGAFEGLSRIEWLYLDGNQLTDVPAGGFASLPRLTRLVLSDNPLGTLAASDFSGIPDLEELYLRRIRLAEIRPGLFSDLVRLERLDLSFNRLNELRPGVFLGLGKVKGLNLRGNPGAPFPLTLELSRTDTDDLLAPGPATVNVVLEQGAPLNTLIPLSVHGGQLSDSTVILGTGTDRSGAATVTRPAGSQTATQVVAGPAPALPSAIDGVELLVADPLVLFSTASNRAPVPQLRLPWLRMRLGGESASLEVSSYFRDPDGDLLAYQVSSADPAVASAEASGGQVTVVPVGPGSATVTVTATDPGGLSAYTSFPVSVRGASPGSYDIDLILIDEVSESVQAAFDDAVDYWSSILAGTELPNVSIPQDFELGCWDIKTRQTLPSVDDLVIVASVREIDGPFGILASAGPCAIRDGEGGLPFMGAMQFDVDDLELLEERGDMEEVILHEMGHVLGIGTIWHQFDLLVNPSLAVTGNPDTHFPGPRAIAAFDDAGGTAYTDGEKVPVENRAGPGSGDSHWRESILDHELMTPYQNGGVPDPLSAITVQSLADLGYTVDVSIAEPYGLPGAIAPDVVAPVEKIEYGDDILRGPIIVMDSDGRIVRVIPD